MRSFTAPLSAFADVTGNISDVIDYQLVGAAFPVQYLHDDIVPPPEFLQVPSPIVTVPNPGIAAPRDVWFMRPGVDFDLKDPSGISDIVAIRPIPGNLLQLHFWSDDLRPPVTTAAQFRAALGLAGAPFGGVVGEDGRPRWTVKTGHYVEHYIMAAMLSAGLC